MEYSEENSSTLPEYHSSLTVLHQLDEFWFYGNILKDDINPKLCLSSPGISPYRSIEMVEKKKLLCGDDSEEERRKKKDREEDEEPIASSSASNLSFSLNFNKNMPCSRFASLIPLSESEANKEEECDMQKPSSSSSSSATTTTSIQHCPNVIVSQHEVYIPSPFLLKSLTRIFRHFNQICRYKIMETRLLSDDASFHRHTVFNIMFPMQYLPALWNLMIEHYELMLSENISTLYTLTHTKSFRSFRHL